MFFDFSTYFKVIRLALTDNLNPKRLLVHITLIVLLSLWAVSNFIFLTLDRIFFPLFQKTEIKEPVFIVGNARSGTTLFHRLLCGDEENYVYFRMWELVLPSLVQKRSIHFIFATLKRISPKAHQGLIDWEAGLLTELKKQHPIGVNNPEEDELLLLTSFSSAMLNILFPYPDDLEHLVIFEQRPVRTRQKILNFYKGCIQRQLYFYGSDRTLVSKNPAFVSKMRDLSTAFPDAKFIYLVRNPFETIPSLLKLLTSMWDELGIDSSHVDNSLRALVDGCIRDYHYALEVLEELPEDRYAIVEYDNLVGDPKATVEEVYARLGLEISPAFDEKLSAERSRQKRYHSMNAYSLEQFGIDAAEIEERLGSLNRRFGFTRDGLPQDVSKELL
jgi:hypothetical protein